MKDRYRPLVYSILDALDKRIHNLASAMGMSRTYAQDLFKDRPEKKGIYYRIVAIDILGEWIDEYAKRGRVCKRQSRALRIMLDEFTVTEQERYGDEWGKNMARAKNLRESIRYAQKNQIDHA